MLQESLLHLLNDDVPKHENVGTSVAAEICGERSASVSHRVHQHGSAQKLNFVCSQFLNLSGIT